MTPPTEDELSDAWQEGDGGGVESLSPRDRDDYLIWDFILGWEMNGLSGHLFNRAPDFDGLRATVAAMRRRGLPELAEIVGEAVDLFARYDEIDWPPSTTWGEMCGRLDPGGRMEMLDDRLLELSGDAHYGLRS